MEINFTFWVQGVDGVWQLAFYLNSVETSAYMDNEKRMFNKYGWCIVRHADGVIVAQSK